MIRCSANSAKPPEQPQHNKDIKHNNQTIKASTDHNTHKQSNNTNQTEQRHKQANNSTIQKNPRPQPFYQALLGLTGDVCKFTLQIHLIRKTQPPTLLSSFCSVL